MGPDQAAWRGDPEVGKLRDLVVFFIRNSPRPLGRTDLVKLIHLFEYERTQMVGHQYSGVQFVRERFGPYSSAVVRELDALVRCGVLAVQCYTVGDGGRAHEYRVADPMLASTYGLPEWEAALAGALIRDVGQLHLRQLKGVAYSTPPMRRLVNREAVLRCRLHRRRLDMSTTKSPKKFTKEQIAEAKRRLDTAPDRGSDELHAAELLRTYKEYEDLRRRASAWLPRK